MITTWACSRRSPVPPWGPWARDPPSRAWRSAPWGRCGRPCRRSDPGRPISPLCIWNRDQEWSLCKRLLAPAFKTFLQNCDSKSLFQILIQNAKTITFSTPGSEILCFLCQMVWNSYPICQFWTNRTFTKMQIYCWQNSCWFLCRHISVGSNEWCLNRLLFVNHLWLPSQVGAAQKEILCD